jgi:hypothetical protein
MYSQLDPQRSKIRTLDLLSGAWGDAIECRLRVVSLDDKPSFKAITYVWGDPQHKRGITHDGQSFFVTQNLFRGLQGVRDPAMKLTIWVDALCINQTDSDERREQIQLMRAIYTSASEVLIWLGIRPT